MSDTQQPASFDSVSRKLEVQVARYNERVRVAAGAHGLPASVVDDVFQEVRTRIWRALREGGEVAEAPLSHLQRTALAAGVDVIRRRHAREREKADPYRRGGVTGTATVAGTTSVEDELSDLVDLEITKLPADRALAVRMQLSGYARQEVAALMSWTDSLTRQTLNRGVAQLRAQLRSHGIGSAEFEGEQRLSTLFNRSMARRAKRPGDCQVSPEAMIDALLRRLVPLERQRVLLAILSDPRCRPEFDLLRALVMEAPGATKVRPARSRMPLVVVTSILLLIALGFAWRTWVPRFSIQFPRRASGAIQLVAPTARPQQSGGLRFVWRSVPGIQRYEYNLVTRSGHVMLIAVAMDTSLTLPDSVKLIPEQELRWWVEATTSDGNRVRSPLRALQIMR